MRRAQKYVSLAWWRQACASYSRSSKKKKFIARKGWEGTTSTTNSSSNNNNNTGDDCHLIQKAEKEIHYLGCFDCRIGGRFFRNYRNPILAESVRSRCYSHLRFHATTTATTTTSSFPHPTRPPPSLLLIIIISQRLSKTHRNNHHHHHGQHCYSHYRQHSRSLRSRLRRLLSLSIL